MNIKTRRRTLVLFDAASIFVACAATLAIAVVAAADVYLRTHYSLNTTVVYKNDTATPPEFVDDAVNLPRIEAVLCSTQEGATAIGALFAEVGATYSRYSVAYDAFLKSGCVRSTAELEGTIVRTIHGPSGDVLVASAAGFDGVEYRVFASPDVLQNVFQCTRDEWEWRVGFDSTLACWRDL